MNIHPRKHLREDLRSLIASAMPDVDVHVNAERDFRMNTDRPAVIIYTPGESITKPPAAAGRPSPPLQRSMTVEILVMTEAKRGADAADAADATCFTLERLLSRDAPALSFNSTDTQLASESSGARALVSMSYTIEKLDNTQTTE